MIQMNIRNLIRIASNTCKHVMEEVGQKILNMLCNNGTGIATIMWKMGNLYKEASVICGLTHKLQNI